MKTFKLFFIVVLVSAAALPACKKTSYTIRGSVDDPRFEGKQVMLSSRLVDGERPRNMDSTVIINGKYTFKGSVQEPNGYRVTIDPVNNETAIRVNIALENAKITISTDADGWSTISGTAFNDRLQEFVDARRISYEKRKEISNAIRDAVEAGTLMPELEQSLNEEWYKYNSEVQEIEFQYLKKLINNPGVWGMTINNAATLMPLERQKELIAGADERTLKLPEIVKIIKRIEALEKTAVGQPFIDLRMSDPVGKEIALSDYVGKGKYVLIDFWASWCGPCRAEMPNVLAAYEKYKGKEFEIVGVSFDSKYESWIKGIKELNLPWPQMSDLKGWDSAGAKLWAVTGIPHTVLLDRDGTIIARNVRGEELMRKLEELIN